MNLGVPFYLNLLLASGFCFLPVCSLAQTKVQYFRFAASKDGYISNIKLFKNAQAKDPSFAELMHFLNETNVELGTYVLDSYDCKHFSADLHNEAHSRGINARFAGVHYVNEDIGHAVVAFRTTDQGEIVADFTKRKSLAFLRPNSPYLTIPLPKRLDEFQNSFNYFNDAYLESEQVTIQEYMFAVEQKLFHTVEEVNYDFLYYQNGFAPEDYENAQVANLWRMTSEVKTWVGPSILHNISKKLIAITGIELANENSNQSLSLWERNSRRHHNIDLSRGVDLAQAEFRRQGRAPASSR